MTSHFAGTHDTSSSPNSNNTSNSSNNNHHHDNPHQHQHQHQQQQLIHKGTYLQRVKRVALDLVSFYPNDPTNPQHRRLMTQAKVRAALVFGCFLYVGYQHPEYSVISAWWHGSDKPLAEQRWEKMSGGDAPGSKRQQNQVESIMTGSTKSVYQQQKEFREEQERKGKWF